MWFVISFLEKIEKPAAMRLWAVPMSLFHVRRRIPDLSAAPQAV
ncbi:hypothetical protein [Lutimaribacter pacificus]|nr:hypothetical protein [Lutimaribacter pacificus]